MKICICDDDQTQLLYLKQLVEKWQRQSQEFCDISLYHNSEELLFENQTSFPFDIMILDIQMGKMNGIELAHKIRRVDKKIVITFLSGISDYVFQGYEVSAFRYLLKPVKEDDFFQLLDTIRDSLRVEKKYIIVNFLGDKQKIEHDDIYYVESLGHYLVIHTKDKEYEIKKTMYEIVEELNSSSFIFTHRSYLVHLMHVNKITKTECILENKTTIPISRNKYQEINNEFIKFYKGGEL